jgi:hypothetical protein
VPLLDDGTGGDAKASDGVYTAVLTLTDPGLHEVKTFASGYIVVYGRPAGDSHFWVGGAQRISVH